LNLKKAGKLVKSGKKWLKKAKIEFLIKVSIDTFKIRDNNISMIITKIRKKVRY